MTMKSNAGTPRRKRPRPVRPPWRFSIPGWGFWYRAWAPLAHRLGMHCWNTYWVPYPGKPRYCTWCGFRERANTPTEGQQ